MIASMMRPSETVAVVGVFEAAVRRQRRSLGERRAQLVLAEERAAVLPLAGIGAVADQPGAVRQQLRERHLGDGRMQAVNKPPCRIVELEPARFAQFHDRGGGEALRMRSDAKAVTRGQCRAGAEIGDAERLFQDHVALGGDRDDATGRLGLAHLKFDPSRDVVERGRQPLLHRTAL